MMEAVLYLLVLGLAFMLVMYFVEVYEDAKLRKKVKNIEDIRKKFDEERRLIYERGNRD